MLKLVIVSDTHTQGRSLVVPDGDVLIHCGDLTYRGTSVELVGELNWFTSLPHKWKLLIAGNHDFGFQDHWRKQQLVNEFPQLIYLENSGVDIDGIKFWGSPVQPWFHDWAFQKQRGDELREHWSKIPDVLDVLITHGPPSGFGDFNLRDERFGDVDLLERVLVVKPQIHCYGHAHHGYGEYFHDGVHFINAASCNEDYRPVNPPVVVDVSSR